jgi:transcriptional regulator with PAS, ATPase and Fis domain
LHAIEAATRCDARVLLIGKTGTGKELIAKAIHSFSSRSDGTFMAIDCGAIPHTLLESEFFGHTRGAFTGAHSERQGLFIKADGGTLFMDEINNLSYDMQSKLLRVIEDGEVRPVGSDDIFKTDIRIIAASSVSLKELVDEKKFREDLFFRLHVYPIYVPDLTERQPDIPLLANHFLQHYAGKYNIKIQNFHEEVIDFMKQRDWKGNIRELENFVERLVTLAPESASVIDSQLFPGDLSKELQHFRERYKQRQPGSSLKENMENYEAQLIRQVLIDCEWNQSEAARRLGISEKGIRYKLRKLHIQKPDIK